MSFITMFDTAFNNQFPPGGEAYAGYVDGHVGSQPNYQYVVSAFPGAYHLSISVFGNDADCLDIESGAATPEMAASWYGRQVARGIARPCFYASASVMAADILPVISASGFPRSAVRLWSAHYGDGEHICGPASCGLVPIDMDGTQWTSTAMGRDLDQSRLHGDFFAGSPIPSPPPVYAEFDMTKIAVLKLGDTDTTGEFWSVHRLQNLLKLTGQLTGIASGAGLAVDGSFGSKTDQAVRDTQSRYHLSVDGVAGPNTWSVLLTGAPA
jgi:peptidoglycan hydrolase-like protein with peptidoglycan-binding domain